MSRKRWFRFYIDRWFKGTTGLSPNEIAAYLTVLCELYDNEGFVRLDVPVMARRCGMRPTSFQAAVDALVQRGKLDIERGFLTNKTVTEEIAAREKVGEKSMKSRLKVREKPNDFNGRASTYRIQNKDNTSSTRVEGSSEIVPFPAASQQLADLLKQKKWRA
jgi:uncharacterized protein YdaU (DUF1376 family)